ncbi:hypothetical protein OIDMADRAFT_118236 [Oidiodendron maius Zn]|uniref:Rhodopsin domain-containing protein n=1 Tax=Oidiodendron maius (strain Zn) TaxID=913774 RepID=A0A0C3HJV3_OIDMZ|nr:hypothetical protein OIDMADRAFT_118236 [Oidiodendron maius Zn]
MLLGSDLHGRSEGIFIGVTTTFVLASVFVTARLFLAFGMTFAIDFGTHKGLGLHEKNIPAAWQAPLLASEYAAIVLYNPALMATKTSILLLYLRFMQYQPKVLYYSTHVILAVVNVSGVVLTFISAFQCQQVQAAYNLAIQNPKCISIETIYLASAPINVATDVAILVLPIPVLTTLPLPVRQKTVLVLTFLLGVFATVVDVARIYYVQLAATSLSDLSSTKLTTSLEFSYNASLALLWSAVEVNVGIMCACITTLRPLLKRLVPKTSSYRNRGSSYWRSALVTGAQATSPDPINHSEIPGWPIAAAENQESQMRVRSSLATVDTEPGARQDIARHHSQQAEHSNMARVATTEVPACLLDVRGTESVKYCALICVILFVIGFTFTILFSVVGEIPVITTQLQAIGISTASYGGVIIGPLFGYPLLRNFGFKVTFITALGITCVGTLMFWPSGALNSYVGFIVANFVVGVASSFIDISAISFLVLCGPPQYLEFRVLFGEAVEALGGMLSQLLAQKVLFVNVNDTRSLIDIQWAYLAIAFFTVLLALVFYYMPIPEATESDLRSRSDTLGIDHPQRNFGKFSVFHTALAIAALSAFCSAGALTCVRIFLSDIISAISLSTHTSLVITNANFQIALTAGYSVGELIFAFLSLIIPPPILLLFGFASSIVFSVLVRNVEWISAGGLETASLVFSLCLSFVVNLIFAIAGRNSGEGVKLVICVLESAAGLGASALPFVIYAINTVGGYSIQFSFCVVIALFAAGTVYPLYDSLLRVARRSTSPLLTTQL